MGPIDTRPNPRPLRTTLEIVTLSWVFGSVWQTTITGVPLTRFACELHATPWQFGLLTAGPGGYFDAEAAHVASTSAELLAVGLEPRHLRSFRTAADREATLITQLVSAQARQRDPDARERAGAEAAQLAATVLRLHSQLVKAGLRRDLGR